MRKAIYAGSFDPPTLGHRYVIEEACRLFDELVIAVAVNPDKKSTFTADERVDMLRDMTGESKTCVVRAVQLRDEYVVNYAQAHGIDFVIRGIRSVGDFEYERTIRHVNAAMQPSVTSVFLMPPKHLEDISSSFVRGMVGPRGWRRTVPKFVTLKVYKALELKYAQKRWNESAGQELGEKDFKVVAAAYSEPHRAYHNLDHILHTLEELDQILAFNPEDVRAKLVGTALWFHDVVYDPQRSDNEERSADYYCSLTPPHRRWSTRPMILATKYHAEAHDHPTKVMVDCDMAILGQPTEEYQRYAANIRQEYSFVADDAFKEGRMKFLNGLLARPSIYLTDFFRARYESQARANIQAEIDSLTMQLRAAHGVYS
jgi:pantetheine-phosphate adenylyltransferase